ncbi:hypothetical protein ACFL6I_21195 [candidate division KSB1 bacterium]
MGDRKIKAGIMGYGKVGTELQKRLSYTQHFNKLERHKDPIEKIYVEIKENNEHLLPDIDARSRFSRIYTEPVLVSKEGYSKFTDCDVILICAGAEIPEEWIDNGKRSGTYGYSELESMVRAQGRAFDPADLQEAYKVFNIMRELKDDGVNIGYRALRLFPRNVPIMKKYARILDDIGFENLTMILSNVPDYCCNVFAGTVPRLAEILMGMTHIDTMRISCDIMQKNPMTGQLEDYVNIIIPIIGNHDEEMIFAPELITYEYAPGVSVKSQDRRFMSKIMDKIEEELMENSTLNEKCANITQIIKEYAPKNKEVRSIIEDEITATTDILAAIQSNKNDLLTNSIFHMMDEIERTGVFVTLPHKMDWITIKPEPYNLEIPNQGRLERCIDGHKIMVRRFVQDDVIKGLPMLLEEDEGTRTIFSGDAPPDMYLITKDARKNGKKKLNLYHPLTSEQPADSFDYDAKKALKYVSFDGNFVVINLRESKGSSGNRSVENTILKYDPDNPTTPEITVVPGKISEKVIAIDDLVYVASTEDNNTAIRVFENNTEVKTYKTEDDSKIYSLAIADVDGTKIFGSSDSKVYVWEKDSKKPTKPNFVMEADGVSLSDMKVAGNFCFASDSFSKVYMWDIKKKKLLDMLPSEGGMYDVEVIDGEVKLALITEEDSTEKFWIKTYSVLKTGHIDKSTPEIKKSTTEFPEYLSFVNGNIIVKKGGNLCYADELTKFEPFKIECADLETIAVYGGQDGA